MLSQKQEHQGHTSPLYKLNIKKNLNVQVGLRVLF